LFSSPDATITVSVTAFSFVKLQLELTHQVQKSTFATSQPAPEAVTVVVADSNEPVAVVQPMEELKAQLKQEIAEDQQQQATAATHPVLSVKPQLLSTPQASARKPKHAQRSAQKTPYVCLKQLNVPTLQGDLEGGSLAVQEYRCRLLGLHYALWQLKRGRNVLFPFGSPKKK
jgi:hypothetical protein